MPWTAQWVRALLLALAGPGADGGWVSPSQGFAIGHKELAESRLIRIGSTYGILVAPNGSVTAARWLDDDLHLPVQPELLRALADAHEARESSRAPCPNAADGQDACSAWCRAVLPEQPGVVAKLEGKPCSFDRHKSPQCLCQEQGNSFASCLTRCPAEATLTSSTTSTTVSSIGTGASKPHVQPTMTTTTTSKRQKQESELSESGSSKYLLYDSRYHLSFAAQIEVLFVALELVEELTRRGKDSCISSGSQCVQWTLVLPPWCSVTRWYSENAGKGTQWGELFDLSKLSGSGVAVLDFADYMRLETSGKASVELSVLPAQAGHKGHGNLKDGHGDFLGYAKDIQACESNGQQVPQSGFTRGSLVYSGYCDSDISVSNFRCAMLRGSSVKALADLAGANSNKRTRSLLLKHLDGIRLHSPDGVLSQKFQPALRPAAALRDAAKIFTEDALGSMAYLGVHLRRNDFLKTHAATTPDAKAAAMRINRILQKKDLEQVFVATDAESGFRQKLRAHVKAALYFFAPDDGAIMPQLKGQEELIVLQIVAKAQHFIGSAGSAFSAAVRRERQVQGFSKKSSEEVFCDDLTETNSSRRCVAAQFR
eukprot:TRINITY_DN63180_c0_g1_i1.p1 TRINITY_DN63180_c0_g1~~TRINITY_DN63180_c0_g1_i1.p1  ORF type:complete len:611 (-),score=115.86 TRINITY_DN63180_c0_g1_i1:61-1854(-)